MPSCLVLAPTNHHSRVFLLSPDHLSTSWVLNLSLFKSAYESTQAQIAAPATSQPWARLLPFEAPLWCLLHFSVNVRVRTSHNYLSHCIPFYSGFIAFTTQLDGKCFPKIPGTSYVSHPNDPLPRILLDNIRFCWPLLSAADPFLLWIWCTSLLWSFHFSAHPLGRRWSSRCLPHSSSRHLCSARGISWSLMASSTICLPTDDPKSFLLSSSWNFTMMVAAEKQE